MDGSAAGLVGVGFDGLGLDVLDGQERKASAQKTTQDHPGSAATTATAATA